MNLVSIDLVNQLTVSGTPDTCRSRVREWTDAGATFPIIVPLSDNYEEIVECFSGKFS
jgi:5,10-methylenetetrahydromethanopterin reductase